MPLACRTKVRPICYPVNIDRRHFVPVDETKHYSLVAKTSIFNSSD
jgi:hypothetical protein